MKPGECPGDNVDFNIKGLDRNNVARSGDVMVCKKDTTLGQTRESMAVMRKKDFIEKNMPVPHVMEEIVVVGKIFQQERVQQRTVGVSDVPVPQFLEEVFEVSEAILQERIRSA